MLGKQLGVRKHNNGVCVCLCFTSTAASCVVYQAALRLTSGERSPFTTTASHSDFRSTKSRRVVYSEQCPHVLTSSGKLQIHVQGHRILFGQWAQPECDLHSYSTGDGNNLHHLSTYKYITWNNYHGKAAGTLSSSSNCIRTHLHICQTPGTHTIRKRKMCNIALFFYGWVKFQAFSILSSQWSVEGFQGVSPCCSSSCRLTNC